MSFMIDGPSFDYGIAGFQAGLDLYRRLGADGAFDRAGFSFGAANGNADVKHIPGGMAGSINTNAYQLGGYWTHFGPQGWYLDAVVQATWYQDASARSLKGENVGTDGWGALASLEGGYPLRFGDGWAIEPQAQLIYQRVAIGDMSDRFALVRYGDTDQWLGRLGARLVKTFALSDGRAPRTLTTWGRFNLWHDFGSGADMTISNLYGGNPIRLVTDRATTWAQFELGLTGQLADNAFLFASGDYKVTAGGTSAHSFGGRVGLKFSW